MSTNLVNVIKLFAAASLLSALCACTAPQNSPSMVDYSYVPPTAAITVETATMGMEDF